MNISEFLAMGGYGFYIWSAWGITLAFLLLLAWTPYQQHKQLLRQIQIRQKRQRLFEQEPAE